MVPSTFTALRSVFTVFSFCLATMWSRLAIMKLAALMAALCFRTSCCSRGGPGELDLLTDSELELALGVWSPREGVHRLFDVSRFRPSRLHSAVLVLVVVVVVVVLVVGPGLLTPPSDWLSSCAFCNGTTSLGCALSRSVGVLNFIPITNPLRAGVPLPTPRWLCVDPPPLPVSDFTEPPWPLGFFLRIVDLLIPGPEHLRACWFSR